MLQEEEDDVKSTPVKKRKLGPEFAMEAGVETEYYFVDETVGMDRRHQ